jgi:hypothetical protein
MSANNFKQDLEWSESRHAADWWEPYYARAFPLMSSVQRVSGKCSGQLAGIDKFIILKGGKRLAVDEKVRRDRKPTDIALEFLHVQVGAGRDWPGWIEKPNQFTDYLAYGFQAYRVAFFFPFVTLQAAWLNHRESWKQDYGIIKAPNPRDAPRYHTHSCPVPTEVLMGHLLCAMRIQL